MTPEKRLAAVAAVIIVNDDDNECPLYIEVLRLKGHVTVYKQSHAVVSAVQCYMPV